MGETVQRNRRIRFARERWPAVAFVLLPGVTSQFPRETWPSPLVSSCMSTATGSGADERAWDVLADVATWIASRGIETERGCEIHGVNGKAERQENVDNNAFVNIAAAVALREAVALAEPLGQWPTSAGSASRARCSCGWTGS